MINHHSAVLALALLLAACKPQATPAPAAPAQPAATIAAPTAPAPAAPPATATAAIADADQALQQLVARLQRDALYADGCVSYASDDQDDAADGFAFVVRERHGQGCPGDPQTAPVRDRFRVGRDGALQWYDIVDGEYVDYAERSRRLEQLQAG